MFLKIFYFQLYLLQSEKIVTFFCNTNFNQNNTIQEYNLTSYDTNLQCQHRPTNTQNRIVFFILQKVVASIDTCLHLEGKSEYGNKPAQLTKATFNSASYIRVLPHVILRLLLHPLVFGIVHLYQNVPSGAKHGWEVLHPVSAAEHDDILCNGRLHKQASPPKGFNPSLSYPFFACLLYFPNWFGMPFI